MMKVSRKKQSGNLLAAAVIIIVGLASFGLSVIQTVSSSSVSSDLSLQGYQAKYLAESGLEYGSYQVKTNIDISDPAAYCNGQWKATQSFSQGQFKFKCTQYVPNIVTTTAINDTSLIVPISTTANVAPVGRIQIGTEIIDYTNVSTDASICGTAPCLVVKNRGANNTLATSHSSGDAILQAQLLIEAEGAVPSLASPKAIVTQQKAIAINVLSYTNGWAVGKDGTVYRRNNNIWQRVTVSPSTLYDFNAVTCPSSDDCWLVGNGETVYHWNGSLWSQYTGINFNGVSVSLKSITCTSASDCWIITSNDDAYHWDGTDWTFSANFSETLNGISCPSASFCMISADDGKVYNWDGSAWSAMSTATSQDLYSISCPSSSLCFAVGKNGVIEKYSSGSWVSDSSPITLDLITVSCGDVNNCWAFGTNRDRNARYYYGSWKNETVAISNKHISNVYCATYNQCFLAVNRFDQLDALIGIWNGLSWGNDFVQTGAAEDLYSVTTDHTVSTELQFENIAWRQVFN